MGYGIRATDGKMVQVHDILVDDEDWQIVYVIIDTSKWNPWSKKVKLSIEWMDTISYVNSELNVNLNSDQIKNAPEFDPEHPIGMDYEKALAKYYDQIFKEQKKS